MPLPFVYKKGERVLLQAIVVDDHDVSNPQFSVGGYHLSIPQEYADRADTRTSGRPMTAEEKDREEIRKAEAEAAENAKRVAEEAAGGAHGVEPSAGSSQGGPQA